MFIFTVVMVIAAIAESAVRCICGLLTNLMTRDGLRDWSKNSVAPSMRVF